FFYSSRRRTTIFSRDWSSDVCSSDLTTSDVSYQFSREVLDLTALLEVNFFSFDHPTNKETVFTPYFSLGVGSVFYKRYTEDNGRSEEHTELQSRENLVCRLLLEKKKK